MSRARLILSWIMWSTTGGVVGFVLLEGLLAILAAVSQ